MRGISRTERILGVAALGAMALLAIVLAVTAPARPTEPACLPDRHAIPSGVGVNVQLQGLPAQAIAQQLDGVKAAGFTWIRQRMSWADTEPTPGQLAWDAWDAIVDGAASRGLQVILVLEDAPAWAKAPKDVPFAGAPPRDPDTFARFAEQVAARFRGKVAAYQVWDEPNLGAHWGSDGVNPAAYAALLGAGYRGIRRGDADAVVLAAGLAPTTERSPANLNDLDFLRGLYAAGAGPFFDALAYKPYGFWSDPDTAADPNVTNFARAELIYDILCENGDGHKGIWAVEFGWNALPDNWTGKPSPWGTDRAERQEARSVLAVRRARAQWPWMGPMIWAAFRPQAPADDPVWGFALVSPDGQARAFARELGALSALHYTGPGRYEASPSAATWLGDWRFSPLGADIGKTGDAVEIPFTGTRIDLHLRPGDYWAVLYATVDGAPANRLPKTADGKAYIVLYDPANQPATVTVASHLDNGHHILRLEAEGGWGQWALAGWSVLREEHGHLPVWLLAIPAAVLAFVLFGSALWWARVVYRWVERARWLHGKVFALGIAIGVALFLWRGPAWLPLVGLALLIVCSIVRRDIALGAIAASLPFYQVYGAVLGRHASLTLALLATAVIAAICDGYLVWVVEGSLGRRVYGLRYTWKRVQDRFAGWWRNLDAMDFAVVALVVVSALSIPGSQRTDVSVREWVQVVLAAAVFYALIHAQKGSRPAWILVDWLTAGATAVSLVAIVQFITGSGVITAEGVLRVRGFYGSPNNLALFLGRTLPIALCLAAFGRRRQIAYGLAAVPQLAAVFLTFSRGALLLGIPAALIFIGIVRRGKTLWAMLGSAAAIVASLIPLAGTQRVASLLQTGQGTTFLRLNLWRAAWNMIREHPWRGVGLDNFLYAYRSRFILPVAWEERNLSHPHNFVLDWWTRLGIPGLAILAWLLGVFFATIVRLYRSRTDRTLRAVTLGLAASMIDALAHGLVDNMFFLTDLALVFALTLGVVGLLRRERGE